jgi:tRNA A-37 threonylcarbamoyl transferase component Bud32
MRLVCPHCQNPIELVETSQGEVLCPSCGSTIRLENTSTTAWSPSDGQRKLGKFELIERIGMGAFGTVYKARDSQLGRIVAIKVPRSGSLAGKEDLDRFMREARSVAQLRHPSIVSVYDVGQTDDLPYLVSEFVEGLTLADLLTARQRTPREAAELIAAVADTLQYAHDHGIVHRDVKPSNILLDKEGKPHLMDFGLAKRDAGEVTMTLDGQVLGTPAYMSPEQAGGEGHKVDGRSDIYSLGVILYELLTGALPFQGSTRALLHQVQHEDPRQPRSVNKSVPRDLETICLKSMGKDPGQRYATAHELAEDLRRFLAGEPIKARPMSSFRRTVRWFRRRREVAWMLAGAVAAVILIGTLGILFAPEDHSEGARNQSEGLQIPAVRSSTLEGDPKPLPADLELVPRDAFGFVSVRLADLLQNRGVMRLQERIGKEIPELKPLMDKWKEEAEKEIGIHPAKIERVTLIFSSLPDFSRKEAQENWGFAIVKTIEKYDRALVLNTLKDGYLEKKEGDRTYYVAKGESAEAIFFVNDQIFVSGAASSLVSQLLRPQASSQSGGPLQRALDLISEEHQIAAAAIPPPQFKQFAAAGFAKYQKALPLLEADTGAVLVRLKSIISPDPFGDTLSLDYRLFYRDDVTANAALEAGKATVAQVHQELVQEFQRLDQQGKKQIQQLEKAGASHLVPVIRWVTQFGNRFEEALNSAEVQRQDTTVTIRLRLVADLPEWGVDWARLINYFQNPDVASKLGALVYARTESQKNLKKLAEAIHTYHTKQTEPHLPAHALFGPDGKPLLSWRVMILPYLDENDLFRQFHLNEPWDSEHNKKLLSKMPKVFRAPIDSSPNPTKTFYQVFVGKGTLFEGRSGLPVEMIPNAGEKTLLIVEGGGVVPWTKPQDLEYDPGKPIPKLFGNDPEGFSAVFYNSGTRFIKNTIDEKTLRALISRTESGQVDLNKLP